MGGYGGVLTRLAGADAESDPSWVGALRRKAAERGRMNAGVVLEALGKKKEDGKLGGPERASARDAAKASKARQQNS